MDQPDWKWNKTVNTGVFLTRVLYEIERDVFLFLFPARWQYSFGLSFNQWHHRIFSTSFFESVCKREPEISHRPKKGGLQQRGRLRVWAIEMNLSSLSTVSFDPWGHVLAGVGVGVGVLWVWCRDCRKAQEMNVLSAHAKKTRLQRGRRNKYLNLTHLLLPSQTTQAADGFLSSNKTRFSLAWWGLPLLSRFHIWYLEWEYSAWLVETVGLRLWCLLSRAPLRLCSTGAEQHILLTQWKTECGRRWRSASVGRLQCPVQQQNLEHEKDSVCSRFAVQCKSVKQASLPLRKFRSEELLGGSEQHHSPDRHIESVLWVEDWPSHLFPFQSNSILKPEPQDPL